MREDESSSEGRSARLNPGRTEDLQLPIEPDFVLRQWYNDIQNRDNVTVWEKLHTVANYPSTPLSDSSAYLSSNYQKIEALGLVDAYFGRDEAADAAGMAGIAADTANTDLAVGQHTVGSLYSPSRIRVSGRRPSASTIVTIDASSTDHSALLVASQSELRGSSASLPSLAEVDTADSSSLHTSAVDDYMRRQTALVQDGPVINRPGHDQGTTPELVPTDQCLQCVFFLMGCKEKFDDVELWRDHCNYHLMRQPEPEKTKCNLCPISDLSWYEYLDHVVESHRGERLSRNMPDAELARHLMNHGLINNIDFVVILEKGNSRDSNGGVFAESYDPRRERRVLARRDGLSRPTNPRIADTGLSLR